MITVQERLDRANAFMTQKHGTDPNNATYKKAKRDIIYAWEHGIDVKDVLQHRRKSSIEEALNERVPTIAEIEKGLGRELRNISSLPKGHVRVVVNPFTMQRWQSVQTLATHLNVSTDIVRGRISKKRPILGNYYEYEQ